MDMDEPVKELTPQQIEEARAFTLRWFEKLKSRVTAVSLATEGVEDWIKSAPVEGLEVESENERPIGERFTIRDNQIIKKSNGEVVPWDEPLFLLRGRDLLALSLLYEYRRMCAANGCDYLLELLDLTIGKFTKFKEDYPEMMKKPGVTRGK